ncbi:hypothetical protein SAY87_010715 [Trapa incisa]|uniref:LRR receptor-like serine/threonine-protein kinase n=1 Tax=Trapa incisa TaxID=236973 RepID=A0AAN7GHH7_9MYRT|nr:hypothetical protein SAY87_010715 [Trapa incisa]
MKEVGRSKPERLRSAANCFFTTAFIIILCLTHAAHGQNQTQATTDPDEDLPILSIQSPIRLTDWKVYALSVSGTIPDELWNLTYLFNLNLAQNVLTGPLSPSIGNLNRMQYLTFGINALSGEIPKELGMLSSLISLGFGTNNFSGPLPSELANLTKLEQLQNSCLLLNVAVPVAERVGPHNKLLSSNTSTDYPSPGIAMQSRPSDIISEGHL